MNIRTTLRTAPVLLCSFLIGCSTETGGEPDDIPANDGEQQPTGGNTTVGDDDDGGNYGDDDDAYSSDDDDSTPYGDDDDGGEVTEEDPEDAEGEGCGDAFSAPVTLFLSADDSNSMADPTLNRQLLLEVGQVPTAAKPWEYLNEAEWDFEPSEPGHVRIEASLTQTGSDPDTYGMLIAVVAPHVEPPERAPLNLVFSVDTSGSMAGGGLARAKDAMSTIAGGLQEGDVVSIVRWSGSSAVLLDSYQVDGPNDATLLETIDDMSTGGATNLANGVEAAYEQIDLNSSAGRANRVVLISDGGANVGALTADLIAERAVDAEEEGTYLIGIGVPPATNYDHVLMDAVTDLGRGAYLYIGTPDDAERLLAPDQLPSLFQVAAREVRLGLTLPPNFVMDHFSGEESGWTPGAVTPQNLAANDQMLYDLDLIDCGGDGVAQGATFVVTVEWVDPTTGANHVDVAEMALADLLVASPRNWLKADALVAYAESFAAVAGADPWAAGYLQSVAQRVDAAVLYLPYDEDLAEVQEELQAWLNLL